MICLINGDINRKSKCFVYVIKSQSIWFYRVLLVLNIPTSLSSENSRASITGFSLDERLLETFGDLVRVYFFTDV